MKQLSFFESSPDSAPWHLYVDGAARNNPGPAGAGLHLIRNGKTVLKKGYFLGPKTNNQAEYLALLLGLFNAAKKVGAHDSLEIFADSQLLVQQMKGVYKVKDVQLKLLQSIAFKLLMNFTTYSFMHVPRAENAHADEMANEGIDKKIKPPTEFITLLNTHEISL
jgi:ribonuclease HI